MAFLIGKNEIFQTDLITCAETFVHRVTLVTVKNIV
jgi:hypothetical protein